MEKASSPEQMLQSLDDVKRLVDIVGIDEDAGGELPIVEVHTLMDKDSFNRLPKDKTGKSVEVQTKQEGAMVEMEPLEVDVPTIPCTDDQFGKGPNTLDPQGVPTDPEGIETPPRSQISENPWGEIFLEGIDV